MKACRSAFVFLVLAGVFSGLSARAANFYWNHAGGNNLWSNPANWTSNAVPASNDTIYLANNPVVDEPQTIELDRIACVATIYCTATGNRSYTINPGSGGELVFLGSTDIQGTRSVPLTINAKMRYVGSLSVQRRGPLLALNGSIVPDGVVGSCLASDAGTIGLGGSNSFSYVRNDAGGEVIAAHVHALGNDYFRNNAATGILSLASDVELTGGLQVNADLNLRLYGAGVSNATLTVGDDISGAARLTVVPPVGGASGRFTLYLRKDLGAGSAPAIHFEGPGAILTSNLTTRITWSSVCSGDASFSVKGEAGIYLYSTNTYTGGTFVLGGTMWLSGDDRLPTNGLVTVCSPAILDMHGYTTHVAGVTGDGKVDLDATTNAGAFIVTGTLAPGLGGAGSLTCTAVSASSDFILGPASTSVFELDGVTGVSDKVVFNSNKGNLTLDGTLKVENLGGLEFGSYTLFDLAGGVLSGGFTGIDMPAGFLGTLDTSSGDVVLNVKKGTAGGALLQVR